ncbi:hypothetical protein HPP92_027012 [Vanilla planifolia]|uniref:Uncharacterized protein n=1 Tax=Vanilla planifolia TaxID=51239 RepID=A0A835PAP5_VANPL|nr:hypothetical protein HPP92_027012 [Vanilla planifolia]
MGLHQLATKYSPLCCIRAITRRIVGELDDVGCIVPRFLLCCVRVRGVPLSRRQHQQTLCTDRVLRSFFGLSSSFPGSSVRWLPRSWKVFHTPDRSGSRRMQFCE